MQGTPWQSNVGVDADIFDGLTLIFDNVWRTSVDDLTSDWNTPNINYDFSFGFESITIGGIQLDPVFLPSNYELRVSDEVVDSTSNQFPDILPPSPRKFEIYNTTGGYKIEYLHLDRNGDMLPSVNPGQTERILFYERDREGNFTIFTWQLVVKLADDNEPYAFEGGEILTLTAKFPFNKFDLFTFQTETEKIDMPQARNDLNDVIVYPNPYIAAHEFEPGLPPSVTSGRGERRMYFTNLPIDSKIYIFTSRGDLVRTLEGGWDLNNGTVIWDLKTRENLDVAFGVYFYVVESEVGVKRGKLAIIK
jgi:hypothetical protein